MPLSSGPSLPTSLSSPRRSRDLRPGGRLLSPALLLSLVLIAPLGCSGEDPGTPPTAPPARSASDSGAPVPTAVGEPTPSTGPAFRGFRARGPESGLTTPQRSGASPPETILGVKSTGIAVLDFDSDGVLDLLFTQGSTPGRWVAGEMGEPVLLYRGLGKLRFEAVADRAGLPDFRWATGVAVADLEGDGDDDLLVTSFGADRLFRNESGRFAEIESSGLSADGWSTSAAFADLDGDGILDLYVARNLSIDLANPPTNGTEWSCLWEGFEVVCGPRGLPAERDAVYRGRGDGTFEEVTELWGFAAATPGYGLAVVIGDIVGDRTPEIFVANDSSPNHLWSRRDGKWREIGFLNGLSVDANGEEQAGMGADLGDIDGDGRLDLVVSNFERESENVYIADARGSFFDRTDRLGVAAASRPTLSWGLGLEDFDLDGDLDLFVANGHVYPQADQVTTSAGYAQVDQLYRLEAGPTGKPRFADRSAALGITEKGVSRGAVFADLDGDGDLEIVVSRRDETPLLYENLGTPGARSLTIALVQPGKNLAAIGAAVSVDFGESAGALGRWSDRVRRQSSFQSSGVATITRGIPSKTAGRVQVIWPDGTAETFPVDATATQLTCTRGEGGTP